MTTPEYITIPTPRIGGKIWLLDRKGLFILETGPGTIRTIACTHAGSGQLEVFDGIPNDRGFFPDEEMPEPKPYNAEEMLALREGREIQSLLWKNDRHREYGNRNGRPFYRANPIVMGSWMLDGGFTHGLTVRSVGENDGVNAFASIVWMPHRAARVATTVETRVRGTGTEVPTPEMAAVA